MGWNEVRLDGVGQDGWDGIGWDGIAQNRTTKKRIEMKLEKRHNSLP